MPVYRIKTPFETVVRKRADSAHSTLLQAVYHCISANGGMDSEWGNRAMREAEKADVKRGGTISTAHFTVFYTCSHA